MAEMQRAIILLLLVVTPLVPDVTGTDDVTLESLQTLVQQQAASISSLQASLAAMQNSLTADSARISTLETQVSTLSKAGKGRY
jgi:septal ring factor EnvC (AmiA/AmiB activator)